MTQTLHVTLIIQQQAAPINRDIDKFQKVIDTVETIKLTPPIKVAPANIL